MNPKITIKTPWQFLASGFGAGMSPVAPGTAGTIVGLIIWYLLLGHLSTLTYLLVIAIAFAVGITICQKASDELGVHDHGGIVWDEFVGFWITMIAAPVGVLPALIGFCLFRFFDVLKPWPIKPIDEKVGGGFGIMIDDVIAGIFAFICMQIIFLLFPSLSII